MTGAVAKCPVTLISVFIFETAIDTKLAVSTTVGILGGVMYGFARSLKLRDNEEKEVKKA